MNPLLDFLHTHEEAFRSRARLASLYSDFRFQRHTNPDGFQANSAAWLRALSAAAKEGLLPSQSNARHDRYVLHAGEGLTRALHTQDFGRPLALDAVIGDAVRRRDLIPLKDFLESKQSIYATSLVPTPWQVVSWALHQLGLDDLPSSEDKLVNGDFVIKANIEAAAKAVLDDISNTATSNSSRIFSRELFISSFSSLLGVDVLSATDVSVLLTHLARDRAAIAFAPATGTIKFKAPGEAQPSAISQEDVTIASLRTLISSLEPQIQQCILKVSELDAAARQAVAKKQLTVAKSALRAKRLADAKLQQRSTTLAQLEEVYAKIEQAQDQVEIVRIMEASSQTLRNLNKHTGGVEKVQDVVDSLQDEMTTAQEVTQAMNGVSAGAVDEGEVEDELEALEKMEKAKLEEAARKEREKKEADEAEATRKRLAELDQTALTSANRENIATGQTHGDHVVSASTSTVDPSAS